MIAFLLGGVVFASGFLSSELIEVFRILKQDARQEFVSRGISPEDELPDVTQNLLGSDAANHFTARLVAEPNSDSELEAEPMFQSNSIPEPEPKPPVRLPSVVEMLSPNDIIQFDIWYRERRLSLRQSIAQGAQNGVLPLPWQFAEQLEGIQMRVDTIATIPIYAVSQRSIKKSLIRAFTLLKECYEMELNFLQAYPQQSYDISFVMRSIEKINSKDRLSALQFLKFLKAYRAVLSQNITDGTEASDRETHVQLLMRVNMLVDQYEEELEIGAET